MKKLLVAVFAFLIFTLPCSAADVGFSNGGTPGFGGGGGAPPNAQFYLNAAQVGLANAVLLNTANPLPAIKGGTGLSNVSYDYLSTNNGVCAMGQTVQVLAVNVGNAYLPDPRTLPGGRLYYITPQLDCTINATGIGGNGISYRGGQLPSLAIHAGDYVSIVTDGSYYNVFSIVNVTAATARLEIGAAASGVNGDILRLTGLTGSCTITMGSDATALTINAAGGSGSNVQVWNGATGSANIGADSSINTTASIHAGSSFTGGNLSLTPSGASTITPTADVVVLTLQQHTGGGQDIQIWKDATGAAVGTFKNNGNMQAGGFTAATGGVVATDLLRMTTGGTGTIGIGGTVTVTCIPCTTTSFIELMDTGALGGLAVTTRSNGSFVVTGTAGDTFNWKHQDNQ